MSTEETQSRIMEELKEFLSIPSISTDPGRKDDVERAADFVKENLKAIGCDEVKKFPTQGHPIIYGSKTINVNAPTVLIYGHYDVQPADPLELWNSDPFDPQIKEEKIFARGASDDKGQVFIHMKAVEALVAENKLACNIKFLIEGEEEIGSIHLSDFLQENKDLLEADVVTVSDTSMISMETPSITIGLRGLCYVEIELKGPERDLHSGVYGGAVINPINALTKLLSEMVDSKGQIVVPELYDSVKVFSDEERNQIGLAPFDIEEYKREIGVDYVGGEEGYSTLERVGIRPSLDVNGIWGGYIGEGAKTVLPSVANAKVSIRLAAGQDSEVITKKLCEYLENSAPKGTTIKVKPHHGGQPYLTSTDSVPYKIAETAVEKVFGKRPIPTLEGGSIPVISEFKQVLKLDSILIGFGLNSDAIHSPNEHLGLKNFWLGYETMKEFYASFNSIDPHVER